jgi:hypothetical protein
VPKPPVVNTEPTSCCCTCCCSVWALNPEGAACSQTLTAIASFQNGVKMSFAATTGRALQFALPAAILSIAFRSAFDGACGITGG